MAKKMKPVAAEKSIVSHGFTGMTEESPEEHDSRIEQERMDRDYEHFGVKRENVNMSAESKKTELDNMDISRFNSKGDDNPEVEVSRETTFMRQARSKRLPSNEMDKEEYW